jgi:hypothetical protein
MTPEWKKLEEEVQKKLKRVVSCFPTYSLRLYDTRSAGIYLPEQPSDFLVWTPKRDTVFLEVKHSSVHESLRSCFSMVSDGQLASARLVKRAQQSYRILFNSGLSGVYELWDGFYCAERRAVGKPLELSKRLMVTTRFDEVIEQGIFEFDDVASFRLRFKEKQAR